MSKRHQASRRKAYGKRQHDVRERQERRHHQESAVFELEAWGSAAPADPFAYFDPRAPRFRFAIGD